MKRVRRAAHGALGGIGATLALWGFRKLLSLVGLIGTTAPEQVVERLEEVGLVDDWSPLARRLLAITAHFAYGSGIGLALGLLREERGDVVEESAVGSALGILAWGASWTTLLPLTGVHRPPWRQRSPRVLLPVTDHAFFGAVWGLLYRWVRA